MPLPSAFDMLHAGAQLSVDLVPVQNSCNETRSGDAPSRASYRSSCPPGFSRARQSTDWATPATP
jgi:hypothetical protein